MKPLNQPKSSATLLSLALLALLTIVVAGCAGTAPAPSPTQAPAASVPAATVAPTKAPASPASSPTPASILIPVAAAGQFTDPFVFCAAVGTLDAPDARFAGPRTPEAVLNGLRQVMNVSSAMPNDVFERGTFWRCMGGKVYGCNVGANIPCTAKAVTGTTPTQAMNDFCKANPASDFLPAAVTGRETVYSWKCVNGVATVDKELTKPDAAGFLSIFWYEIAGK